MVEMGEGNERRVEMKQGGLPSRHQSFSRDLLWEFRVALTLSSLASDCATDEMRTRHQETATSATVSQQCVLLQGRRYILVDSAFCKPLKRSKLQHGKYRQR